MVQAHEPVFRGFFSMAQLPHKKLSMLESEFPQSTLILRKLPAFPV